MSPMDWYRDMAESPGRFPHRGQPLRLIGGPAHGQRMAAPVDDAVRYAEPDPDADVWAWGSAPEYRSTVTTSYRVRTYRLRELAHVPRPGCEGPIGVEWVLVDEDLLT